MKAIHQLIAYFQETGRLGAKDLRLLAEKGYWGEHTADDIRSLEHKIGQSFFMRVTGNASGSLWGTDVYTSDSDLGRIMVLDSGFPDAHERAHR